METPNVSSMHFSSSTGDVSIPACRLCGMFGSLHLGLAAISWELGWEPAALIWVVTAVLTFTTAWIARGE